MWRHAVWRYYEIPDGIRMPHCSRCRNLSRVKQIARATYYCSDCDHVFRAVWEANKLPNEEDHASHEAEAS
jgi:ribosomal protein L37AE/L43A